VSRAGHLGTELLPLAQRVRRAKARTGAAGEGTIEEERSAEEGNRRADLKQRDPEGSPGEKLLRPERRRQCAQGDTSSTVKGSHKTRKNFGILIREGISH
jgi:hypothetical protein